MEGAAGRKIRSLQYVEEGIHARYIGPPLSPAQVAAESLASAFLLNEYILAHGEMFRGRVVLELGSGLGIPGIVCAHYAREIYLTDKDSLALAAIRDNVALNPTGNAKTLQLEWGLFSESMLRLPSIDFIIAADCFYNPSHFDDIMATVASQVQRNPACRSIIVYHVRSYKRTLSSLLEKWNLRAKTIDCRALKTRLVSRGSDHVPELPWLALVDRMLMFEMTA